MNRTTGLAVVSLVAALSLFLVAFAEESEQGLGGARNQVDDVTVTHILVLAERLEKATPEAREVFLTAMGESLQGREQALAAIERAGREDSEKENGDAVADDNGYADAAEAVENLTDRNIEVLTGLLEEVPEEARPAIERAIERSQQGRQSALSAIMSARRAERRPELDRPERPEPVGPERPERPGRPRGRP